MYFYPVAACRDPTRVGTVDKLKQTALCRPHVNAI